MDIIYTKNMYKAVIIKCSNEIFLRKNKEKYLHKLKAVITK